MRTVKFTVDGIDYWYFDGEGFNYAAYREGVLKEIARQFYRIPLPVWGYPFLERYDLAAACGVTLRK